MTQTLYPAHRSLPKSKTLKASCFLLSACNLDFVAGITPSELLVHDSCDSY